jgi:deoxyribodipyrimidine photolyase-related protein
MRTPPRPFGALWRTIVRAGVRSFGEPSAAREPFAWPLNRDEALRHLDAFVEHALPHFGDTRTP